MTTSTPAGNAARITTPSDLLRPALRLDAVATGLNGVAYLLGALLLDDLLGLSSGLLLGAGAFLVLFTAAVWLVGNGAPPSRAAARTVVVLNLLWAAGSLVAVATGLFTPTTTGAVWLVLQAVVVATFAALQVAGLRRRP